VTGPAPAAALARVAAAAAAAAVIAARVPADQLADALYAASLVPEYSP
jgi:hypothetical protein